MNEFMIAVYTWGSIIFVLFVIALINTLWEYHKREKILNNIIIKLTDQDAFEDWMLTPRQNDLLKEIRQDLNKKMIKLTLKEQKLKVKKEKMLN